MSKSYDYTDTKRGLRVTYEAEITARTKPLDVFAKVFAKDPYTAIVQPIGSNNLYVSFPEHKKNDKLNSIPEDQCRELKTDLQKVVETRAMKWFLKLQRKHCF
ncbi:hypothetical protein [Rickettsia helvetica]|uniref:Uncharacterized protein n=1 Tax=Rickettsia helvetica TaxID=35789 RepID=A0ABP0T3B6_RICHE|nr:hypothetical protein [Rickettsia helvetica]MCZ6884254.1 hypothetical protein [Rickettsia endosymbiont of Ixodes ricinus]MCZ6897006.1 hypothetical protein [Rickettsia endosymbiont of Ixodes ricinus]